jgi:hypothetical protein
MADFSLYLTHSVEDEAWQMVCTDAGCQTIVPGSPYPPRDEDHPQAFSSVATGRRINEYQLVYILEGRGTLDANRRYEVGPGTLFLVFPGVRHAYRPDPAVGWTEYWVGFQGPHVDALMDQGILSPERSVFHPGYQASLVGAFQTIFQLVKTQTKPPTTSARSSRPTRE